MVTCFYPKIFLWSHIGLLAQLFFLLLLCHSVINPIIISLMAKEVRQAMVFCRKRAKEESESLMPSRSVIMALSRASIQGGHVLTENILGDLSLSDPVDSLTDG